MENKNLDLIISINVHENVNFLFKQIENIKNYLSCSFKIILNCNEYMYNELKNKDNIPEYILINDEYFEKKRYSGLLIKGIMSNMDLALQNFEFKYFLILSSRTVFHRKLNIEVLDMKKQSFLAKNIFINQCDNREMFLNNFKKTTYNNQLTKGTDSKLFKYYRHEHKLKSFGCAHEGLVFSYNVCNNISNFLNNNSEIKDDMFNNIGSAMEEWALQTISIYEVDFENKDFGFYIIGSGVREVIHRGSYTHKVKRFK